MSYQEPINRSRIELEIKKSRFIGFATKVNNRYEAMTFIDELKQTYPDARHICWGYIVGDPNNSTNAGCHDDGEPSGTAGKPILTQINYSLIGNVIVVVVRYFGGIRLGAGGLVRAYREAAQAALLALKTKPFIALEKLTIELPFHEENTIRQLIAGLEGELISADYNTKVKFSVKVPALSINELGSSLAKMEATIMAESGCVTFNGFYLVFQTVKNKQCFQYPQ